MTVLRPLRQLVRALLVTAGVVALATPTFAHVGSLSSSLRPVPVPFWLVVAFGGGVVGVSFLFTSLLTDHETIRFINGRGVRLPVRDAARAVVSSVCRGVGAATLLVVVTVGVVGPQVPLTNLAILVVWVGWWAGFSISTYLVVDSWPAFNPWRTLAALVPKEPRMYPSRMGKWPSVAGLLLLVWLEVVSPVSENPHALVAVVVGYSVVTVAGAVTYGEAWFENADPVSRVFRLYGRLAPIQRTDDGISLSFPGAALARHPDAADADEVAFVVALLWVTTYDGLASTPAWNGVVRAVATIGVPPLAVHLVTVFAGFALAVATYRFAARLARRTANTYVTVRFIAGWFADALVPIAAGYHLAHFLGYFLALAPVLVTVALDPLSPPATVPTLSLPAWFGALQLVFVLVGHVLAIWVAHARAFALFPGRLQPIRSQYSFAVVMVLYTMTSLWIVAQPFATPLT